MSASEALVQTDFQFLQKLIYEQTGIVIGDHKREMIFRRISRRMRDLDIEDISYYCSILRDNKSIDEMNNFINAVTTNLTSFFRENHHFEFLKDDFLRGFSRSGKKRLRIWSSACSTGEEPYSIAISLKEALGDNIKRLDAKILATDLDTQVIQTAKAGIYEKDRLKDLNTNIKSQWFSTNNDIQFKVDEQLKSLITFNKLNLLGPWPISGKFDVIFCRNVLIYFDKPTQEKLVNRFYDVLEDGGILMLGHSESVLKGSNVFTNKGKTIYQKKGM